MSNNEEEKKKKQEASFYETYEPYTESDKVKSAAEALANQVKPDAYKSPWQTQLNDAMDKILNREAFKYDMNADPLYSQYKDRYVQQGKLAMGDAIGQASAMTGGYGNTYAAQVGQQQFQQHLNGLNDRIPELYQMALNQYNNEGDRMLNEYAILEGRENEAYSKWRDSMSDYNTERAYLQGIYDSERTNDYNRYLTERDAAYTAHRDLIEDARYEDDAVYQAAQDFATSSGKYGYDNGAVSEENIKIMQEALGVTPDGKWGAGSYSASNKLTADEAWKAYQDGTLGKSDLTYDDVVADIEYNLGKGGTTAEIEEYIKLAFDEGIITPEQYAELIARYGKTPNRGGVGIPGKKDQVTQLK